ncbi:family 16 glycosylhydrolase [candidate division KSB1 bacterium]|nr:family 16 glycosylhydrolase [candidate division KSB1 bacterium]
MNALISKKAIIFLLVVLPSLCFGKLYKGAEYRTKESYLYGRFEVRYKASAGSGQTSTFFTYNDIDPLTRWNEIDIEILGRYSNDVQFNVITPRQGNNHVRHQYVDFDPTLDFHTYTIEWTPDYIAWFIDHVEVYRQTGEHIQTMIKPQKIMMNIWNPVWEGWVGPWYDRALPQFAFYDYVSYASYTPGEGNIGTDNNFSMQWKDDFDSWDQSRWDKATHTFGGNNCDFLPENIVFQDGYMILCLTDNDNTGYIDNKEPYILSARARENLVTINFTEQIDQASAESTGNYAITNATVTSAKLLEDKRRVQLTVDGMAPDQPHSLVASGIFDTSPNSNRLFAQMVNITMPQPLSFPVKINVGGGATGDFLPDQPWSEEVEYGYQDGQSSVISSTQEIQGTNIPEIYRSERWGLVTYQIRVPSGIYELTLLMAENYFDQPDKRVFDIYVEGNPVSNQLDLYSTVGKHAAHTVTLSNLEINDGIMNIHFSTVKNNALLNGIIIEEIETGVIQGNAPEQSRHFALANYPNPFNSTTRINYEIPEEGFVKIDIYDVRGHKVKSLLKESKSAGNHSILFKTEKLTSGVYFCKLQFAQFFETIRMVLLR